MKLVYFHPDAESEMIDAAVWYETQQTNLGKRFLTSVQNAINRVKLHPNLYPFAKTMFVVALPKRFLSVSYFGSSTAKSKSWPSCTSTETRTIGKIEVSNNRGHLTGNSHS